MSKMVLSGHRGSQFKLNVIQYRSPMSASINSVQVKTMLHHFPIRAGQPDIQFTVLFRSRDDKHEFQNFTRDHQRNAQTDQNGLVTLFWPERDIINWTGHIISLPVQEKWDTFSPKVTFGVALVDSLMSTRTKMASSGAAFSSVLGPQVPLIDGLISWAEDSLLQLPSQISNLFGGGGR